MKRVAVVIGTFISTLLLFYFHLAAQEEVKPTIEDRILVCSKAFEALGKIGNPQAKGVLIQGLKSKEFFIRAYAAQALGRLNDKEVIPLLKGLISDENYLARIMATKALVQLGEPNMEELIFRFLRDKDAAIRASAVEQLGGFFKDKYLSKLFEILLKDNSYLVREKIIQVLGGNKFEPATKYIIQALEDENTQVRLAACNAIFQIRDKQALSLLKNKLNDKDNSVRARAKELLSQLGEKSLYKSLWQDAQDKDPLTKANSYVALANLKYIKILPVLLKAVITPDNSRLVKTQAARALEILKLYVNESLMKSTGNILSTQNLEAGYKVNGKNLVLIIVEALKDKKNPLHQDAPLILKELGEEISLPALREALFQDEPETVATVAFVLGEFQDKNALSYLIKICQNYGF